MFLPPLFSSPHPSTFPHPPSIHTRGSLLPHCPVLSHIPQVCTQSRIVCVSYRAHSQGSFRTHTHRTGCVHSRTDEYTHIHISLHKTNRHAFMCAHDHKHTLIFICAHCIHTHLHTQDVSHRGRDSSILIPFFFTPSCFSLSLAFCSLIF